MGELVEGARGKWGGILESCGIDKTLLTGKHSACPLCGGKDRFRWDNRDGRGTWICTNCKSGDGFELLKRFLGVDYRECARIVRQKSGMAAYEAPKPAVPPAQARASMVALWKQSEPVVAGDIVDRYLTARGITLRSPALRKIHQCRASTGRMHPAMLAMVSDAAGSPKYCTIHRTYLDGDRKADIEAPREFMQGKVPPGAAVRLCEAGLTLGIAEGIETALAAAQLYNIPVWATLNACLLEKWVPPEGVKNVYIFGDNDSGKSYTGEKSAYSLANRLSLKGLPVTVFIPQRVGWDWNDELIEKGKSVFA